jgi:site-specific recombinase XerD
MGRAVTRIKLDYVHAFHDRHGRLRHYFRRHGKRTPLPGVPGSAGFMEAYQAALAMQKPTGTIGANRTKPGTLNAAVAGYVKSVAFLSLATSTQKNYRGVLNRFRADRGDKSIATLEPRHLNKILADMIETPEAANLLVKVLRGLMAWCVAEGWRKDDPTSGIKAIPTDSEGFLPWPQEYVDKYRSHYALGTRERLALELLTGTGQARCDVVRMGRQHVRNGILSMRRQKTGVPLDIMVLPELQAAIDAMPTTASMTFLMTSYGKSFTAAGFGQRFRHWCDEAGIPTGYASHGLRKWAATRLAEEGATAHQLMSWFAWKTLAEAERYTKAASRKKMAMEAAALLTRRTS